MSLIHRPICPSCASADTVVEKTLTNLMRIGASTVVAMLAAEVIAVRWRCRGCGERFSAVGTRGERERVR